MSLIGEVEIFQRFFQDRRHFARHADNALTVGAVRRHRNIKEVVVDPDDRTDVRAERRVAVENENTVDLRTVVEIVVDSELLARTEHSLRGDAPQFSRFNFLNAALVLYGGIIERDGNDRARKDVRRRRHDLFFPVTSAIHFADGQSVRVGVFLRRKDLPRDDVLHPRSEIGEFLHLEPAGEEFFLQLLGGHVDLYIIF